METKAEANYRRGGTQRKCSQCEHFIHPDGCEIVSGNISPQGVCDYFKRKAGLSTATKFGG